MEGRDIDLLLDLLRQAEELLNAPEANARRERVSKLLIGIARSSPPGPAANLAMRAMTQAEAACRKGGGEAEASQDHLASLERALREAKEAIQQRSSARGT